MGRSFRDFLTLPFNLTYHTANFRGAGGLGLAPLAFGPFGVLASRRDALAKGLALFAFFQVAAWFATAQESRFLIHVYVLAAVFAALGWQYVARTSRYARALSGLVVAFSILYGLAIILPTRSDDLRAALSPPFEAKRRQQAVPFLESFEYLNHDPGVRKVLILDPYVPAYYSDRPYVKPMGRWGEQTIPDAANVETILSRLPSLGISHILDVSWPGGAFRIREPPPNLVVMFERHDQRVYRVD